VTFEGFCGPSYQYENRWAAIERTVNWYCNVNESQGEKKFTYDLAPSPANVPFTFLPVPAPYNQPNRGLLECRGICYGVNGTVVFSLDANGNYTNIGSVYSDGRPCSMVANGNGQIFIASGGFGYVIPNGGGTGSLIPITTSNFLGASYVTFQDGYIIVASTTPAITGAINQFQISGDDDTPIGDATLWNPANFSIQAGQADRLVALISRREYLRLLGSRRTQIFQNVGSNGIGGFPFQSYNETFIETGCAAPFSLADLGDSLIWIGEDERGQRACWRDAAFQPQRVSNFAIEQQWQSYPSVADAIAFSFIWKGHLFYQITFPSACDTAGNPCTKTWVFDATTSQLIGRSSWHERQFSNATNQLVGRPELFHCYCYGKHLVASGGADGNPGAVYQYSDSRFTDCGTSDDGSQQARPIVRDRIAPHVFNANKRIVFNRIEFELARGVGLDGDGFASNPVLLLRWSNDSGKNWSSEIELPVGGIGEYGIRVLANRLGYGRNRVFHVRCTDPVYFSLVAAELDITPMSS